MRRKGGRKREGLILTFIRPQSKSATVTTMPRITRGLTRLVVTTLLITLLSQHHHTINAVRWNNPLRRIQPRASSSSGSDDGFEFDPFPDIKDDDDRDGRLILTTKISSALCSSAITFYGIGLLLHGRHFPRQLHILTMLRATGFDKLEELVQQARQNYREAYRSAVCHAPDILKGRDTIQSIDERLRDAKHVLKVTKDAKADGKITWSEERRIRKLRRQEIRKLHHDMKRMRRASISVWKLIELLNFNEIQGIVNSFFFQMTAVLASGHSSTRNALFVSYWCYFFSLWTLANKTSQKLSRPLIRLPLKYHLIERNKLDKEMQEFVQNVDTTILFCVSAYLIIWKFGLACQLAASLMVGYIILRGVRGLSSLLFKEKRRVLDMLDREAGGCIVVILSMLALYFRRQGFQEPVLPFRSLSFVEDAVRDSVIVMEKLA
jgi:hypothetical protein